MGIIDPTGGNGPQASGEPPLVCAHCKAPVLVGADGTPNSITLKIPKRSFDGINLETLSAVARLCRPCFSIWLTLSLPVENRIFAIFSRFISEVGISREMKFATASAMMGELVEKMMLDELLQLLDDEPVDAAALGQMIGAAISTELMATMDKEADA